MSGAGALKKTSTFKMVGASKLVKDVQSSQGRSNWFSLCHYFDDSESFKYLMQEWRTKGKR